MSTGFNAPYNEDYDNTYDTTPMVSYVSHGSIVILHVNYGKYWKFGTTPAFLLQ
jgi:hypothetical protein